jgi:hypothetical protein
MDPIVNPTPCLALRRHEKSTRRFIWAYYLLFVHFFLYLSISTAVLIALPNRIAYSDILRDKTGVKFANLLRVADINTCMAMALVFIRVTTASWTGTVAWNVFLLMEKGDIDLQQLNSLVSWKLFRPSKLSEWMYNLSQGLTCSESPVRQYSRRQHSIYGIYVAFILLLMWPATLSAPLLTSAIDWLRYTLFIPDKPVTDAGGYIRGWGGGPQDTWDEYQRSTAVRQYFVARAMEYVYTSVFGSDPLEIDHCRHISKWNKYPNGGEVDHATYACFELNTSNGAMWILILRQWPTDYGLAWTYPLLPRTYPEET